MNDRAFSRIPCWIMRGGTSKAVFLKAADIPADAAHRRQVILRIFGSPDRRQIDGLGGADPLTSKCAVIGPPTRAGADLDVAFYQVGIATDIVKPSLCGNIAAAVALFAVQHGMVPPRPPMTTVAIHDLHSDRTIHADVPTDAYGATVSGDFAIAGVPGSGPRIMLDWHAVTGVETGALLPTGRARDVLAIPGIGDVEVSIVDCGNPVVFVAAAQLGLTGTELPDAANADGPLLRVAEAIRGTAAQAVGLVSHASRSAAENPNHPFLALVSAPADYETYAGASVPATSVDIVARAFFMQAMHKTFPASGALCLGVAARLEGTVAAGLSRHGPAGPAAFRIGHPGGVMEVEIDVREANGGHEVRRAAFGRTARRIMEGFVYLDGASPGSPDPTPE